MTCECYPIAQSDGAPPVRSRIFGRERWDVFELRKRLGVVTGDIPSQRTLHTTGRDAVLSGFFSSSTIWPEMNISSQMIERANEVLAQLEAEHLAEKPLGEMSAGEVRRILIGRSLVHGPEMLLIDEPSNALDIAAQSELRQALRALGPARNRHRPDYSSPGRHPPGNRARGDASPGQNFCRWAQGRIAHRGSPGGAFRSARKRCPPRRLLPRLVV